MRKISSFLFFASLTVASCKKEQPNRTDPAILGQWRWVVQYTEISPFISTPQSTGTEESLVFSSDNSWMRIQNGSTVNSGTFTTAVETNSDGEKVHSVHYLGQNSSTEATDYYSVSNDTLMFSRDLVGWVSGGARFYVSK